MHFIARIVKLDFCVTTETSDNQFDALTTLLKRIQYNIQHE